jgi:RNA polymerase sigma-70 factor (ECF subfamily)
MADLEAALAALPKTQREAFLMTKVSGLSVREAAAALGATEGAVKVGVHRAVKALRSFLDEESEDSGN